MTVFAPMTDPLLDLPPSIETERQMLRSPQAGDGPVFLVTLTESLSELRPLRCQLEDSLRNESGAPDGTLLNGCVYARLSKIGA